MDENIETFWAALQKESSEKILVVGIGNTLKADDGIGSKICDSLKKMVPNNIIDTGTVPENYIQVIVKKNPGIILFIDAIDFGATAGTIRIFNRENLSAAGISTHTLSPRLLTDIIVQNTNASIYFIGIQPKSTKLGLPMSPEVESAGKELSKKMKKLFVLLGA